MSQEPFMTACYGVTEIEALKFDFDVAIIGCEAYGFPLAARLKRAGKIVVHMGGATQILFWNQRKPLGSEFDHRQAL